MAAKKVAARDEIDEQLDVWVLRDPPTSHRLTEGIIERIGIFNYDIRLGMDETLREYELDQRAFSLIGKLRRIGAPYRASAGKLAADMRLSSGAMTNRLDRLEAAGLIRRLPDPHDRRGTIVEPTELGNSLGQDGRRRGPTRDRVHGGPQHGREGGAPRPAAKADGELPGPHPQEAPAAVQRRRGLIRPEPPNAFRE